MSLEDILELAIDDEIEARDYYRRAADHAGNTHTRRMLSGLAAMEQGHADTLRKELDEIAAAAGTWKRAWRTERPLQHTERPAHLRDTP